MTENRADRRGLTHRQKMRSAVLMNEAKTAGLGPQTPKPGRDEAIRRLAVEGATDADMARLFCLSENGVRTIRLNLHTRQLSKEEWDLIQLLRKGRLVSHIASDCCCKHCPWDGNHGA